MKSNKKLGDFGVFLYTDAEEMPPAPGADEYKVLDDSIECSLPSSDRMTYRLKPRRSSKGLKYPRWTFYALYRRPSPEICFTFRIVVELSSLRVGDGDLDLYTGLDVDRGYLLDDLGRRVQIDDTLVQAHLVAFLLEPSPQVSAHLLQAADIAQAQRDAVLVKGRGLFDVLSSGGHFARFSSAQLPTVKIKRDHLELTMLFSPATD
ncbi:hypothetical protein quinque_014838 [Culex quinquefasciatus]